MFVIVWKYSRTSDQKKKKKKYSRKTISIYRLQWFFRYNGFWSNIARINSDYATTGQAIFAGKTKIRLLSRDNQFSLLGIWESLSFKFQSSHGLVDRDLITTNQTKPWDLFWQSVITIHWELWTWTTEFVRDVFCIFRFPSCPKSCV